MKGLNPIAAVLYLASLSGCAALGGLGGFGGNNGGYGGYPNYGNPGGYGGYGYPGYGQPQWNPPMTQTQKDLDTIYNNREKLAKLPPEQQKQVIQRATELQKQRQRELRQYNQQSRGYW
jgi:hypothetical protein